MSSLAASDPCRSMSHATISQGQGYIVRTTSSTLSRIRGDGCDIPVTLSIRHGELKSHEDVRIPAAQLMRAISLSG